MNKPKVAVLIGAAWPDNDASGPVQSVRQIVACFAESVEFEMFARTGAPGQPPRIAHNARREYSWGATTFLDVGPVGARGLRHAVSQARCDRIWLNSVWDREFTLPALVWRRFGNGIPDDAIVSTRGEFAAGALALHSARKHVARSAIDALGLLRGVRLHVTGPVEAADVARSFPLVPLLEAGNVRTIPDRLPHPAGPGSPVRLLFLGRISPVKGLHNAIAALGHLRQPASLTVCGPAHDEAYFAHCREIAGTLPDYVDIEFVGEVANAQAAARYAAADLFLNPSASENFGHTIFESLAAGTPVLTGLATPWHDLERDRAGYNVPSDDHRAIAEVIARHAAMPAEMRAAWRDAARVRAERAANDTSTLAAWDDWFSGRLATGRSST